MPAPEAVVVVLDVADQHSLDRSLQSVLETGAAAVVADPTVADDLTTAVVSAASSAGARYATVLCAGQVLRAPAESSGAASVMDLVPHPFVTTATRPWSVQDPPSWQQSVLLGGGPHGSDALEPAGRAALPNAASRRWLRDVAHRRELARGKALPAPVDSLFDALCLAWAGEHDGALVRALELANSASTPDPLRGCAARIATASAAAIRRPDEAVRAVNVWWSVAPVATAHSWARVLAALSPQHISSLIEILRAEQTEPLAPQVCLAPWLDRALDSFWRAAAIESEGTAGRLLDAMRQRGRVESADEVLAIWRTWRSAGRAMTELVRAWPECGRAALQIVLEQAWEVEPPIVWDDLARAYSSVHGATEALVRIASSLADLLPLESLISWETFRHHKRLQSNSPLISRSENDGTPPIDAVFAAAIAVQAGLGRSAERALSSACLRLSPAEVARAVELVRAAAPKALGLTLTALGEVPGGVVDSSDRFLAT